jgi:hypothetical protein
MHLSGVRWSLSAVLLGLAVALAPAFARAAPAPPESDKKGESPAEKVRRILEQTADSVEIQDQPLEYAIGQIHNETGLNFVVDRQTIQQMGIDMSTGGPAVNVKLQKVKWKTVLRSMLGQYNLSYAIVGEAVAVTSEDMAMLRQMHQRVSVDLDKVVLAAALKQLAKETATNLLVDARAQKEAQTAVSLQLEDVPLETAVRLMADMAGLKPVRVGNVLYVTTKANAAELKADLENQPGQPQPNSRALEEIIQFQQGLQGTVVVPPNGVPARPAPAQPAAPKDEKSDPPPDKDKPEPTDKPPADKEAKPAPAEKPPADAGKKP